MRPSLLLLSAMLAVSGAPVYAQQDDTPLPPEPEFHCEQTDLPEELAQLCASFDGGWRDTMARPVERGRDRPPGAEIAHYPASADA